MHVPVSALHGIYRKLSNKMHQIPKLKWFSSRVAFVFAQSI